ncbi:MAG: TldD/PmbA family protein [candidate division WOR-3 bacterium]
MKEFLKKALEKVDAEYADVRLEERLSTVVHMMGPETEEASEKRVLGGSVRAFHRGGIGFATFSRPEDAPRAAEEASRLARLASEGKSERLAPGVPVEDIVPPEIKGRDPRTVPLEEKAELVRSYNDIMLGVKGVVTTNTAYNDLFLRRVFLSTDGADITEERIYARIVLSATAADGSTVQSRHMAFADQMGYETVLNREGKAEEAAKDAVALLSAPKVQGGLYTVILDPIMAGVFVHEAFGHLSEADHLSRDKKMQEIMKPGQVFGIPELNITDKPIPGQWGYYKYDDEGTEKKTVYLVKEGVLTGRLHSRHTAALMGEEPTGNARAIDYSFPPIVRMSATCIEPGDKGFQELLEGIDKGIYVVSALGGMTELEMFTFSAQKAYMIERGEIKGLVRDVVLSGNVFETLKNIEGIGKDTLFWAGGCGKGMQNPLPVTTAAPHIRIKNVLVGGV